MYKILLNDKLFHDSRIDELALIDPVISLEENSVGTFTFTVPPNHPLYDEIDQRNSLFKVYQDNINEDSLIFTGTCIETSADFFKQEKVYCEGTLSFLNDSVQRQEKYVNKTIGQLLELFIENHNESVENNKHFEVGIITESLRVKTIESCITDLETTLECIKKNIIDAYGGFIRVRVHNSISYIDYLKDSISTNEQVIRLGENLLDFKSNLDSSEIATAIIPVGASIENQTVEGLDIKLNIKSVNDDKDYLYNEEAVENYGWIYKTIAFDEIASAELLKEKGEQYLSDLQFENMIVEAKAIDMHLVDDSVQRIKLSEQIRVISAPHGLNKLFRLTKQSIDINNPENNTFTLGKDERLTLSAKSAQISEEIKKALESIVPASTILTQAKKNASALINANGTNGHVVLHENENGVIYEILIMDTPDINNCTHLWRWNQNGFGYADTKDANGDWIYKTAITMDGAIVADFMTTGKLILAGNGEDDKLTLSIYDGDNLVGYWGADGIKINKGQINLGNDAFTVGIDGRIEARSGFIGHSTAGGMEIERDILGANGTSGTRWNLYSQNAKSGVTTGVGHGTVELTWGGKAFKVGGLGSNTTEKTANAFDNAVNFWVGTDSPNGGFCAIGASRDKQPSGVKHTSYNVGHIKGVDSKGSYDFDVGDATRKDNSDRRLKHDIKELSLELSEQFIMNSRPCEFKFNYEDDVQRYGMIAQEVQELAEDLNIKNIGMIKEKDDGYLSLNYIEFIPHLIKVVQNQQKEIEILKNFISKGENNG